MEEEETTASLIEKACHPISYKATQRRRDGDFHLSVPPSIIRERGSYLQIRSLENGYFFFSSLP